MDVHPGNQPFTDNNNDSDNDHHHGILLSHIHLTCVMFQINMNAADIIVKFCLLFVKV